MNPSVQSFVTVALPIMITILLAMWTSNGRTAELSARITAMRTDMNRRFDEVNTRLERIEHKPDNHEERIVRLEERTSPIHR